jgi:hypothetical protein
MVEGITDEGDYLVPDGRCCYFHQHIGENAVRAVADAAIRKYYGECHLYNMQQEKRKEPSP